MGWSGGVARTLDWYRMGTPVSSGAMRDECVDRLDRGDRGGFPGEVCDSAIAEPGERGARVGRDHHERNVGLTVVHGVTSAAALFFVVHDPDLFGSRRGGDETLGDTARDQADEDTDEVRIFDLHFDRVAAIPVHDVAEDEVAVADLDDDAEALVRSDDDSAFSGSKECERGGAHGGTPAGVDDAWGTHRGKGRQRSYN